MRPIKIECAEDVIPVGTTIINGILAGKIQHKDAGAIAAVLRAQIKAACGQMQQSVARKEKPNVPFLRTRKVT